MTPRFVHDLKNRWRRLVGRPEQRYGDWITTFSGTRFWPADPHPEDVRIDDIAHALARLCRFGGHVDADHFSVAQHCVYVSRHVPKRDAPWGLLHDGSEFAVVDLPRPIKSMLPAYKRIEHGVQRAIALKFGLPAEIPASVHDADVRALLSEKRDVLSPAARRTCWKLEERYRPFDEKIVPWPAEQAEREFLKRFHELFSTRGCAMLTNAVFRRTLCGGDTRSRQRSQR